MRFAATLALMCVIATGCSTAVHHTDTKAAMERLNWTYERCAPIGDVYYDCGPTHALPGASEGLAGAESSNDASAIRGICASGWTYHQGKGCEPNDR
jgi:hypothetical protein